MARSRRKRHTSEKKVEKNYVDGIKAGGGISYKFTSPSRRNIPDRLSLFGIEEMADTLMDVVNERVEFLNPLDRREASFEAQRLLALAIEFAEIKAPRKKPRKGQQREIKRLRALGFEVKVIDGQLPPPLEGK